jgi:dihydrofolate synthase/folylpolyglutamate synthase
MNYEETLAYLFAQLPMFSRIGAAAYKADLTNTIVLCNALNNPQNNFKSIHIAGTNGKGSTSHMLAAMLQQQGYKTGLYTSPHIKDFRERIRINGLPISKEFVVDFTERTQSLCTEIKPSFFELTVAMAFEYFAENKVDIAVIETGLGGRLDSTNIIHPILSVITNIGMDHTNLLGNTLELIAFEKAGIIKENTPVIIGAYLPQTKPIFDSKASEMNVTPIYADDLYEVQKVNSNKNVTTYNVTDKSNLHSEIFELDLTGAYQMKNLKTVLAAEKMLHQLGFYISNENEKHALANVKKLTGMLGRWDVVGHSPTIIHDVGHNKDGISEIIEQLKQEYSNSKYHFVLGFVRDKDISEVLALFPKDASYYFTNAHIPRALPFDALQLMGKEIGLLGNGFDDVNMAIESAKNNSKPEDVIVVCGSFFIISEISEATKVC